MTDFRKMATIRAIDDIRPIENADAIEVAVIGGWKVVIKKGEYSVGQPVIYCEVDSWIPTEIAPFLTKAGHEPKEYNGVKGERLRTVKLRGQISQGLVLPISIITNDSPENGFGFHVPVVIAEGEDVSEALGVQKWEPPQEFFAANTKGNFPSFIRKTDQERIQNIGREIEKRKLSGTKYEVTEKLDGSSMTVFIKNGVVGVCSRNLELKEDDNNTFWATAKSCGLPENLKKFTEKLGFDIAVQGELIGPGIQGNKYQLDKHEFHVYDVFNIDTQEYLLPEDSFGIALSLSLDYVPTIYLNQENNKSTEELLLLAEGKSALNNKTEREGLVFKDMNSDFSFKVISNKWLLKNE